MIAIADRQLSLWSIPSLEHLRTANYGVPSDIRCMSFGATQDRMVLLTSYDAIQHDGTYCEEGILTRSWTVPSLERIDDHYYPSRGSARSIVVFVAGGEQLAIIEYVFRFYFEVLDMSLKPPHASR